MRSSVFTPVVAAGKEFDVPDNMRLRIRESDTSAAVMNGFTVPHANKLPAYNVTRSKYGLVQQKIEKITSKNIFRTCVLRNVILNATKLCLLQLAS